MRKSFLLFVVAMVAAMSVWSQVPQTLTYQAVVRDAEGRLICNSNVGVRISILQGSENGTAVYSDHQAVATNANGLFTMLIGSEDNSLSDINWAAGPYFLKSEIDPTGGSDYTLETVQQLFSVPYALHSHTADSVAGGVTYTETDPVFTAWDKDYNDLTNKPTIPTVPTNVSSFTNDAGYLTENQVLNISNDTIFLTGGGYVKLPAGFSGNYNDLTNKPTIPTVPTNVSSFTNDAGYLTSYSETDPVFTAWNKDYNDLTNKPTIPTVPTNVSAFINDTGYLTNETQILSISNDTIFLTGGSYVKLPAGFSGNYNDLTNKPTIPTVPTNVSAFTNDTGYLTRETQNLEAVAGLGNSVRRQIKDLSDPTDELDAVNLRTMNNTVAHLLDSMTLRYESITHCLDSITHRYDSIMLRLDSIVGTSTGDTTVVVCDSFMWYGTRYTMTGNYQHRLTNAAGFDSILTLHLTINYGTHNSETKTAIGRYAWHGSTYTESGNYTYSYSNSDGCSSVDTLHLTIEPPFNSNGASQSSFTVNSTKKVRFSKGNLRYQASTGIWRFADHQYDYVGDSNSNISLADSNSHWIDLFGWGTSGDSIGFDPWLASTNYSEYYVGDSSTNDLTGSYSQADWGVHNRIENGGNNAGMWRTLTKGEWDTILNYRAASTINGTDSARFAKARVNSVAGLMLFPDSISIPDGITVINVNNTDAAYSGNSYNAEQWGLLESAGVVFLPAAGYRSGASVDLVGTEGYYWSSTHFSDSNAYCLLFLDGNVGMYNRYSRCNGRSVRLVMDYSASGQ